MDPKLQTILAEYDRTRQGELITLLQRVQGELGCIPEEAIFGISEALDVPAAEVFGTLTFYAQFRLTPIGRHLVRVCRGTACHVQGSQRILRRVADFLGIEPGQTREDMAFSLEQIACFGACSLAPVMVVDEDTYGHVTPDRAEEILERYQ